MNEFFFQMVQKQSKFPLFMLVLFRLIIFTLTLMLCVVRDLEVAYVAIDVQIISSHVVILWTIFKLELLLKLLKSQLFLLSLLLFSLELHLEVVRNRIVWRLHAIVVVMGSHDYTAGAQVQVIFEACKWREHRSISVERAISVNSWLCLILFHHFWCKVAWNFFRAYLVMNWYIWSFLRQVYELHLAIQFFLCFW